jgi:hypothetical protein
VSASPERARAIEALLPAAGPFRDGARAAAAADGVGGAFLAGYRAAVRAATGVVDGALAATEDGPLHPARITTALADGRVTGRKAFVTGVPGARSLVVLAKVGQDGDRAVLRAVVVPVDAPGVAFTPMPALPFVPDVPHGVVALTGAPAERVLPGDGWADVVRPFRTVEDVHVVGALAAWLWSRPAGLPREAVGALGAGLAALGALSAADPGSPAVHLALDGVLEGLRGVWAAVALPDPAADAAWRRDLALLRVAERARAARRDAAWAAWHGAGPDVGPQRG